MSDSTPSRPSTASATATGSRLRRLLAVPSRIWLRLLAFNILLVFLPVAGLFTLDTYEQQLLRGQENAMAEQGRLLAAALAASPASPGSEAALDPEHTRQILEGLNRRLTARLRVVDREGNVLADSATFGPRRDDDSAAAEALSPEARQRWSYRLGSALYRFYEQILGRPDPALEEDRGDDPRPLLERPEVRRGLAGEYGAASRPTPGQRSLTLNSVLPIHSGDDDEVVGVVIVSRSTFRILQSLYLIRLAIFRVFLASVAVAVVISLLLGTTLVRPLHRLRREANQLLDRRGRLTGHFRGSKKLDEIGDLSRALEGLSQRLSEHLAFTETFAADMAHELKNPLASIRAAAELMAEAESPADRQRFTALIQGRVARMERILSSARELTRLDVEIEQEARQPVALLPLLEAVLEGYRLRQIDGVRFQLESPVAGEGDEDGRSGQDATVAATPERLEQLFENLLDNAVSFSPEGGTVTVRLAVEGGQALIEIADQGPGIPPEHRDRIFHRFFSYRPPAEGIGDDANEPAEHLGLGLATVRVLTESYGGSITVHDGEGGGAVFRVVLPVVRG
jgi:two-component system, OmpR family, sensor histidine kinase ChvG